MRSGIVILILCLSFDASFSQKIKNDFFALHNIIRGDSTYDTFDEQVLLVKTAGYDGIEINSVDHFERMKAALDKHKFQASYFYVKVNLQEPYFDERLEGYIAELKGSRTIIAPFIISNALSPPGSRGADSLVIRIMRQISDWAKASDLSVAIYPHVKFYVERTDHALALVKSIDRKNLGLSFNLCHWLATSKLDERKNLQPHLRELLPYLKMITICGANNIISQKSDIWNDYILPLGTGSFDTYRLVKYCVKDLKLKVPIGVQCYNIKTDKFQLVQNTIQVWKKYVQRLENER